MRKMSETHKDHRKRVRKKYIQNGIEVFHLHEAVEMLLFYAVPRKDTNELAHHLLNKFGSISSLLDAPLDLLKKAGLSENGAVFIKLIPEFARLYIDDKHSSPIKVLTTDNWGDYLVNKFIGKSNEQVILLLLDSKGKELFCGVISSGSVNASEIYIKKIVELTVLYNASSAVLAHNHPSGMALPSRTDLITTKSIYTALNLLGVQLNDHIIVADNDYVSLAQCKDLADEVFSLAE